MRHETITVQGKPCRVIRDTNSGVLYIVGHCAGCGRDGLVQQAKPDVWRCDACCAARRL